MIEIKNRWTGAVLWSGEAETLRLALRIAIDAGANLSGANLSGANLSGANLYGADLYGANLSGANLYGADLYGANLSGANLSGASLSGANLSGASLSGANLSGASLYGANLSGANLSGANLSGANLSGASLEPIKADFFDVLSHAPSEVSGLRLALVEGRIEGSQYEGECSCLVGTIAAVAHVGYRDLPNLKPDSGRPAERWFLAIHKGDKPKSNPVSAITLAWLDEWVAANPVPEAVPVQ